MEKKILILLFILFCNITYAAFPVVEHMQQELLEEILFSNNNIEREGTYLLAILSVLAALSGYFLVIITFAGAYGGSNSSNFFLFTALAMMISSIVLSLNVVINKKKGYWLSLLGFFLGIIGFLMIIGSD